MALGGEEEMAKRYHYFTEPLPRTRRKLLEIARHQLKQAASRSVRTEDAALLASELRLMAREIDELAAEVATD